MQLTESIVKKILSPYVDPFKIADNGSSQTNFYNHGRLGFFIESKFGVVPNSERGPDLGAGSWEIKTVLIKKGSPGAISIGTVPEYEYRRIKHGPDNQQFVSSDPFKKMKKTLYVYYTKTEDLVDPLYTVDRWKLVDLEDVGAKKAMILREDYKKCVWVMKNYSYAQLSSKKCPITKTHYLSLSCKGDKDYTYPAWKFNSTWTKDIYHGS